MNKKTGVLILNLGTPDDPKPKAVGRYLREFLGDGRVIDIPWLPRQLLVKGIIVPFRKRKSSAEYHKVWTDKGSPLLLYTEELLEKLRHQFKDDQDVTIEMAMRYQSPGMPEVLEKMRKANYDEIIIFPLYPQYASATTGSTLEKAMEIISKWYVIPEVKMISQFWDHPGYIDTMAEIAKDYNWKDYDHVCFSYHGLPERQVDKVYEDRQCSNHSCESEINEENKFCYKATCYGTTRLLAEKLGIPEENYTVCFQSRLDSKWLRPFSDDVIEEQAKKGAKKLLFFSPAFVADCLETIVEIGEAYLEDFEEMGGKELDLVPSLNAHPMWVATCEDLIRSRMS
ncbi:MAG: ferrochelatase [Flavobacteriales bacterium]|nr:ferrochelatase [Flavobacteriales bacterium]